MEAVECIKTRKSIRQFKPDPVPKDLLMNIIQTAQWSPSYKNTQPWELVVLSGAKKEKLTGMLLGLLEQEAASTPDLPHPETWPAPEAARIDQLFEKRAQATGMDMSDPEVMKEGKKANFAFYGAPHVIYLFQSGELSQWSLFDAGLFAQSLMLAAHANGLGTVPQAFVTDYARDIKEFLSIPDTKRLLLGISIGYADMESPANAFRSERSDAHEIVRWVE